MVGYRAPMLNAHARPSSRLLLKASEVCELLGWSEGQLYMAVRRGQLPARRFGRRVVFLKAELLSHLEQLPRMHWRGDSAQ